MVDCECPKKDEEGQQRPRPPDIIGVDKRTGATRGRE